MSFKEFLEIAWNLLIVDGFGVAWRIGLVSCLSVPLAVGILLACYHLVCRKDLLKLDLRHERFFKGAVVGLWIVSVPALTISCGTLTGTLWAGNYLIEVNHLGERIGKSTFRAIAAGMAAAQLEKTKSAQFDLAKSLVKGEEKIRISELSKFTSVHAGDLSAQQLQKLIAIESEGLHKCTAWAVRKSLDTIALYQLGTQGDVMYILLNKVVEHDKVTDNDGLVTVEEISDIACETFLDRSVKQIWAGLVLQFLLPLLALLALLPIVPPLLAWSVRKFLNWRRSRGS